jgi:hypothetical protein
MYSLIKKLLQWPISPTLPKVGTSKKFMGVGALNDSNLVLQGEGFPYTIMESCPYTWGMQSINKSTSLRSWSPNLVLLNQPLKSPITSSPRSTTSSKITFFHLDSWTIGLTSLPFYIISMIWKIGENLLTSKFSK